MFSPNAMADYNKLKVAELKDELKARGISITGLKLKQNFIDKLIEADAVGQTNTPGALVAPSDATERAEANEQASTPNTQDGQSRDEKAPDGIVTSMQLGTQASIAENENYRIFATSGNGEMDIVADKAQAQPETSAAIVRGGITEESAMGESTRPRPEDEETAPIAAEVDEKPEPVSIPAVDGPSSQSARLETLQTALTTSLPAPASDTSTPPVPVKDVIEDSKKRKRRSVTPPPSAADVAQKRARANDGSPRITKSVDAAEEEDSDVAPDVSGESVSKDTQPKLSALEQMQTATDAAEIIREGDGLPEGGQLEIVAATSTIPSGVEVSNEHNSEPPSKPMRLPEKQPLQAGASVALFAGLKKKDPGLSQDSSLSRLRGHDAPPEQSTLPHEDSEERAVAPALHPATSSLYVRNFKRPLHLPTLRAHLAKIARGPTSSSTSDDDPIVAYFLDNIRTHALISFTSIAGASRVRSALHDTRYPDEKTRDPLWIDFIPDDKVQSWIDTESKSGGRGAAQRWEVVYEEGPGGIEAILQEAGAGAGPRRPSAISHRQPSTSGLQRQPSISDVQRPSSITGVHPDRLPLVPLDQTDASNASREDARKVSQPEMSGTGFRALDELFSFTTAKPKLYYKPVSQQVADRRMDMIKDLRFGHANMGKSGDEDMKRYSFEVYRGEEEWVDKGPEFGFGRRGVERMRGGAPIRGGYRGGGGGGGGGGRGGFRDRDGDDTWRGRR
jgi:SAP domain/RNSP1-SAP18 binding (RSB) motif